MALPDDCVQLLPTVPSCISVWFSGGAGFAHLSFPSGGAANLMFLKSKVFGTVSENYFPNYWLRLTSVAL
jgi:hypothetical protein